ncbi:ABC transporter ATP-binding protein [Lentzea cavernae]|uniref:ABC transporter ATP-binding protein n=1 Tax=Lentzea cavernae TaxID=2020703 RepID=A0ABQ3MIC5_9PSEU|nr:ABC transporter ATP-binding protein [Lentzea cavernae]GHH43899.1 putative ABC transporter ATP-binding protein [Lentzea cavernae]
MSLLRVTDLAVSFAGRPGQDPVRVVDGVALHLDAGEILAVVGESGSGKTVTALSLLGLNPTSPTCTTTGSVLVDGTEVIGLDERQWQKVRGSTVAMVFQDPSAALNPLLTIGTQIADAVRAHEPMSREHARRRAVEALELARMPDAKGRLGQYAHELSGGMRQRAAIALAIAPRPRLLIADEPTTALDVAVQAEIMGMLGSLCSDLDMGLILITHDLGVVAGHADRVAVMYAGRLVETGAAAGVLGDPRMPYTQSLLAATPRVDGLARQRLTAIGGRPPNPRERPAGCPFQPRCPVAVDRCSTTRPVRVDLGQGHSAACLLVEQRPTIEPPAVSVHSGPSVGVKILAEFDDVSLSYPVRGGVLRRVTGQVHAVRGVSLSVIRGRTVALVGESGSGKTSLTKMLLRLEKPDRGTVRYDGIDVTKPDRDQLRTLQRDVQVVFQNPYASLDPRMRVRELLAEPMKVHGLDTDEAELVRLLREVGLDAGALDRYPAAFSGGQRQRIAIARALALRPKLIVCDEAVSALDVSVQAQVLNLLADLQQQHGLAYLFITHDLAVVRSVAHDIAVMRDGQVVEAGPAEQIYQDPQHDYTRSLLAMAPGHPTAPQRSTA